MEISKRRSLFAFLVLMVWGSLAANNIIEVPSSRGTHGVNQDRFIRIQAPEEFLNKSETVGLSNIVVTYVGFPDEAKVAFEYAVGIWESLMFSPVPINLVAYWEPMEENNLGHAGATKYYANLDGLPKANFYYPGPLAEKLINRELNTKGDADIVGSFNSTSNWYFGTDGETPAGKFDFVTVVLHEICHPLGFISSFRVNNNLGNWGVEYPYPFIYDGFVQDGENKLLVDVNNYLNSSENLKHALESDNLFFEGPLLTAFTASKAKLYAPGLFSEGSSIDHLDDEFNKGNNALMTHELNTGTSIHHPGIVTLGILGDMGWSNVYIQHEALRNDEAAGDKVIAVKFQADFSSDLIEPRVYYKIDNGTFLFESLNPQAGSTTNFETTISIPGQHQVYYYISVTDKYGREFKHPNTAPEKPHYFFVGEDKTAPSITHVPYSNLSLDNDTMFVLANVTDIFGVDSVWIEHFYNRHKITPYGLREIRKGQFNIIFYYGTLNLKVGDEITYRLVAQDFAGNLNYHPSEGMHKLSIINEPDFITSYETDFEKGVNEFEADGIEFTQPDGFENMALHTTHPYENAVWGNTKNYTIELKYPVEIKETNHFIQFDEITLIEPRSNGSVWGDEGFNDFAIVEASLHNETNWKPLSSAWDAFSNKDWESHYYTKMVGDDSEALGKPDLYHRHLIDMLQSGDFQTGDRVKIRFRMQVNSSASGWGWAIDNLKIQTEGLSNTTLTEQSTKVFPNPVVGNRFQINSSEVITSIKLYNLNGAKVYHVKGENIKEIELPCQLSGIHVLILQSSNALVYRKVSFE